MKLTPTPPEILDQLMQDPLSKRCWRKLAMDDHECKGRLTWEHALLHAGKRVNEPWALVRLCEYAHSLGQFMDAGILSKDINRWIAFSRIENWSQVESKYPRTTWRQDFKYLVGLYGVCRLSEGA